MTWFRAFEKGSWELRFWRKTNLRFNQDQFGMTRIKYISRFKDLCLRFSRCDAGQRFFNLVVLTSSLIILMDVKDKLLYEPIYKPKKEKQDADSLKFNKEAKQKLFFNRFGANTRPLRSIDDAISFILSPEAIQNASDFIGEPNASAATDDILNGLDSWMTDQDRKMMQYYKRSKHKGGHH